MSQKWTRPVISLLRLHCHDIVANQNHTSRVSIFKMSVSCRVSYYLAKCPGLELIERSTGMEPCSYLPLRSATQWWSVWARTKTIIYRPHSFAVLCLEWSATEWHRPWVHHQPHSDSFKAHYIKQYCFVQPILNMTARIAWYKFTYLLIFFTYPSFPFSPFIFHLAHFPLFYRAPGFDWPFCHCTIAQAPSLLGWIRLFRCILSYKSRSHHKLFRKKCLWDMSTP